MISTILDRITPINKESQIGYFKAAFETNFNEHFPTQREIKDKSYEKYKLQPSQIIYNLYILFKHLSGKIILFNDAEAALEVLTYIKRLFKDDTYWNKYKYLKPLLKVIIKLINIRIPFKHSYISHVNKNFESAIDKMTSKDLYDRIIQRLSIVSRREHKDNKKILDMYDIYHKLLRRDISDEEYKTYIDIINEKIPKEYEIKLNNRKDYMRTLTNYLNKTEEEQDKEEQEEQDKEEEQEEQDKEHKKVVEKTESNEAYKTLLNRKHKNKAKSTSKKNLKGYRITVSEAIISNDDVTDKAFIKDLEFETFYSPYTNDEEIYNDIKQQIGERPDIPSQLTSDGYITFTYKLTKEEYHANIDGDCLKVALRCYNIDFDGIFEDLITNEEILNNVGFYNVYGYFIFGNNKTSDKILLYRNHAVAINTNFKRIHTKDNITTQILPYNEFNHKINICISKNIPFRCFYNKINKGYIEIFESDSDFNKYNKPITGIWIKYKYIVDDKIYINKNSKQNNNNKSYYTYDDDNDYEYEYIDEFEVDDEYYNQLYNEPDNNEEFIISDNYFAQMENYDNEEQYIKLQTMDYDYIEMMEDSREEFIKLTSWFDNKIIKRCKELMKKYKQEDNDEYINKHKFDIIPPVFPYSYRERCAYIKHILGEDVLIHPYNAIDMNKAYLTSFKNMDMIFCISNVPMKEMIKGTSIDDYIIFVKSDIVYNGFYESYAKEIIEDIDKNATYEYYRIYDQFDINTKEIDIKNYKIVFGMLISGETEYRYMDLTNNAYIRNIRADYNYNGLLHLNIMINRNMNMLREIVLQYKENNALPKGYVVDSILYDIDDNINEAQTEEFKDPDTEPNNKYSNVDQQYRQKYNYHFGVAGSGKSTELMELYRDNEVVIVNNYNLYKMYQDKGINVILWQRFLNEHQSIYATKIYVDEIFTFLNTDIEKLFYMCNINNIWVSLFGDYNQLEPVRDKWRINSLSPCLRYVEHDYKYTNYRNTLDYNGKDAWIMDINNNSLSDKRKRYIKRLIKEGFVKISNKGKTIRYYKKDAEENEKIYNGKYYMIKNYGTSSVPSKLKLICQTDVLYTKEELKDILGDRYDKYKRYFVNNNCVSFYNTQGQTLKKIHIINKETIDAIAKSGRMFYVFISRLKGDITVY